MSIYQESGIKLQGQIESFDQFVILLRNAVSQMVYKHAISTVVPARMVKVPMQGQIDTVPLWVNQAIRSRVLIVFRPARLW